MAFPQVLPPPPKKTKQFVVSTANMPPASSPLSSPPTSQPGPQPARQTNAPSTLRQYRPPRALPFELSQHVLIYFEETLYTQAFNLLISLLSSSSASRDPAAPAFVPSPIHLSLAATLAVHPTLTTRTTSREKHDQANAAFRLLRLTNKIVGPVGADVNSAFAFKRFVTNFSRPAGQRSDCDSGDTNSPTGEEKIDTPFARNESLWSRAEDFWHIVGWAFNCSCLKSTPTYAQRWERWSLWLEFMLQVLEDDWEARYAAGECQRSLMWQCITTASGGYGKHRRILRAIFADGCEKATNEFREVFKNELREPTKESEKVKKREVDVNVEAEIYGDYLARDDDDFSDEEILPTAGKRARTRDPSTRRVTPRNSAASLKGEHESGESELPSGKAAIPGGSETPSLRLRLLYLLSNVAGQFPRDFMEPEELFTLFIEFIRPLPVPAFQLLVLPSLFPAFSEDAHLTLCELLLQRMLEAAAPNTHSERYLTQSKMEKFYLPYAANKASHVDNAKVSLLLESMLRCFFRAGSLQQTPELRKALEAGIEARRRKARNDSQGMGKNDDGVAWAWLTESGERMRDIVSRLEHMP
jgi:hypothetical protein